MSKQKEPRRPADPRMRSNIYGLGALYLLYLYYQIAKPFLTRDPYGPTVGQFALGTAVLLGGAAALGYLSWRMRKVPLPEEDPEEMEEAPPVRERGDEEDE